LASERVFIVLSGRGKRPVWSRPELQNAEIVPLPPLIKEHVKEQLEKMKSRYTSKYEKIADLSGGYPLIVRVMGESKKELPEALNDAIDIIIKDTLPESEKEEKRYSEIRAQIEKLSLVSIPYRIPDIEEYLYPNDPDGRAKTNQLISILLASYILRYEGKGYQLSRSITHPIQSWLMMSKQQTEYYQYLTLLNQVSNKLQKEYPSARQWYQRMLPEGISSNSASIQGHNFQASNIA
jgi:hypothetical protein